MAKRLGKLESYKVKQLVFALVLVVVLALVYLSLLNEEATATVLVSAFVLLLIGFLVSQYDFLLTLKEYERAVIYRFGRVSRVGGPGWTMMFPIIESFKLVDLRTQTIDVPPQEVITSDKIVVTVDAVVFLNIKSDAESVTNSVIKVDDYLKSAREFVIASIRDVSGGLTLTQMISNIGEVNVRLEKALAKITTAWGVKVDAVQISSIKIPKELEEALTRQKSAEQNRLARIELAEAHKAEIDAVRQAAEQLNDKVLAYYYIRAIEKLSEGSSSKIFFPIELSRLAHEISGSFAGGGLDAQKLQEAMKKYEPLFKKLAETP